jgi:recombination protein RecT
MFELVNGFRKTMYWSREKMIAHADRYSMAFSASAYKKILDGKIPQGDMWKYSSFWYKDFDGMAYKTMLRQLISKWGVMSIDLQAALDKDTAVTYGDGSVEYVDNSADFTQGIVDVTTSEEPLNEPRADGKQVSLNDL